jgi:hypothetical protein
LEFTGQGWLNRRAQLKASLDLLAEKPDQPLQIVLFIHGWKHSADKENANDLSFYDGCLPILESSMKKTVATANAKLPSL